MKRRIKQNVWGNWKGYLGTRQALDFGTDEVSARHWLETGTTGRQIPAQSLAAFGESASFRSLAAAGKWDWENNRPKEA